MPTPIVFVLIALIVTLFILRESRKTRVYPVKHSLISFYGDSIKRGDGLLVRPVVRRTELSLGAFTGVDFSLGGSTVQDATLGDERLPYRGPFSEWIKKDPSVIVAIGHAGANALRYPDKIDEYDELLTAMINQAKASGKVVVLEGMTWVGSPIPDISEEDATRIQKALTDFDARTHTIAIREGCTFLDVRSVVSIGREDMMDQVHPNQSYSDRVSAYVATKLIQVIQEEL